MASNVLERLWTLRSQTSWKLPGAMAEPPSNLLDRKWTLRSRTFDARSAQDQRLIHPYPLHRRSVLQQHLPAPSGTDCIDAPTLSR